MQRLVILTLPRVLAAIAASVVLTVDSACADDWPQWRGPQRDGLSSETGLLKEWPKEGPPLVWERKDIGLGYSTPAVRGDRIYLLGNEGDENEFVQALAVKDGSRAWRTQLGKVGPNQRQNYPGSRSTPTVDGEVLYALGSDGDLACVDLSNGAVSWKKNLRSDFGGKPGSWAYAESPLVDGDVLVCTPGGADATIVALSKRSGDVLWRSAIPGGDEAAYASAVVTEIGGVRQYIQFLGKGVVGVDAKSGKLLWRYEGTAQGSPANIPTPVTQGDYVYSSSGRGGGALVKIKAAAGGFEVEPVYAGRKLPTDIGGAVLVGEHLYGTGGSLMCVNFKTGEIAWDDRALGAASISHADGRLYLHAQETGEVGLAEATSSGYREKGRFTPPNLPERGRSKAWTYPVVANGRLYIRDWDTLWCYNVAASSR